ncbi:MAG TPA: hypothetical protein VGB88_01615 [Alphaproteobacteria bacterium]
MSRQTNVLAVALVILAAPFLHACATVVKGSTQPFTVATDPGRAKCEISRDGAMVGAVSSTPGTIQISKSANGLEIACTRDGYLDTRQTVASGTSGWAAGNILFGLLGGGVGLVVDAASGSMSEYPETVRFALYPASFPTAEARDRFFATRAEDIEAKFRLVEEQFDRSCAQASAGRQTRNDCEDNKAALKAASDRSLAELEQQKQSAVIADDQIAAELRTSDRPYGGAQP